MSLSALLHRLNDVQTALERQNERLRLLKDESALPVILDPASHESMASGADQKSAGR